MSLVKWNNYGDFGRLMEEFFDANGDLFKQGKLSSFGAADVSIKENEIIAEVDMPGMKVEDIDIHFDGRYLKVSGKREEEKEENRENFYSREIRKGNFERFIQLPTDEIDEENINATYKLGVLTIKIPKREKKVKKIEIKVEE